MTRLGIELVRSERRRRWTWAEKEQLVAASFGPGVSASEVAREAGLYVSQLFGWRKLLCERVVPPAPVPSLLPVAIVPTSSSTPVEPSPRRSRTRRPNGVIEIELGGSRRLTVGRDVNAAALHRVLNALEGRCSATHNLELSPLEWNTVANVSQKKMPNRPYETE